MLAVVVLVFGTLEAQEERQVLVVLVVVVVAVKAILALQMEQQILAEEVGVLLVEPLLV
jgi:hypothetical protein